MSQKLKTTSRQKVRQAVERLLLLIEPRLALTEMARPGGLAEIESHLDDLVAAARQTKTERPEACMAQMLEHVCPKCPYQAASGYCALRRGGHCVIYRHAPAIMQALWGALEQLGDEEYFASHPARRPPVAVAPG